jgi:hypothetical protein
MASHNRRGPLTACVLALAWSLCACGHSPTGPSQVDLEAFKSLARQKSCADKINRLYLIDGRLVFHQVEGSCSDAAYAYTLYGASPSDVKCRLADSIGGPQRSCTDPSESGLFDTIVGHLSQPDLGVGSGHTVAAVPF